jgi:hypothetical protein
MDSGRAIQFITVDPDTGNLQIEEEAAAILGTYISIISIYIILSK